MKRVVALLGVLGFLVAAGPAQAGVLDVTQSSDGTYHMTYWVPRYSASYVHVYGYPTVTIFVDRLQPVDLNDSTGTCVITAFGRISCDVAVSTVSARLSAENDVYRVTGLPWLSGLLGTTSSQGEPGTTSSTAVRAMTC